MGGGAQALTHAVRLSASALLRNRVQTALALLGVTVGVGALVTSIALGRGAQAAIQEQLLAAGANTIVVTAGNYQVQRPQNLEETVGHGPAAAAVLPPGGADRVVSLLPQRWARAGGHMLQVHFEDDPMAVHDHPTARERLGDTMAGLGAAATLTLDDARAIQRELAGVQFVSSGVHENARIVAGPVAGRSWLTRLHGTESDLPAIRRGWVFPNGRFLSVADVSGSAQVMVLGRVVADRLFGTAANPVGQRVTLWNQPFEVIGVVGSRSWAAQPAPGDDQFDAVYVPVSTVHRLLNLSKLNTITVTTRSAGETTQVAAQIAQLLRKSHGIGESMPDDFTVKTQAQQALGRGLPPDLARIISASMGNVDQLTLEQLSGSLRKTNATLLALLAGVAAVSLLVGGIGVANLLLLSVMQRTREIGLRMALGATSADISRQFILEGVVLAAIGGAAGALLGVLAAAMLDQWIGWAARVAPLSLVLALVVALLLGVVSALYPARRAAVLDPIRALTHE